MYIKLKYIQISLNIYQHISYHVQNQKKKQQKNKKKTYQIPNKWQYLTCIKMVKNLGKSDYIISECS